MTATPTTAEPTAPPAQYLFAEPPSEADMRRAALELDRALDASPLAGLSTLVRYDGRGRVRIELDLRTPEAAAALVRVIHKSTKGAFKTAQALRAVFAVHQLDMPEPCVRRGQIHLGQLSVSAADHLARLLGAEPQENVTDLADYPEAHQVIDRLGAAFKAATNGGFLNLTFHPDCARCGAEPAIDTGAISVRVARRLLDALQFGACT